MKKILILCIVSFISIFLVSGYTAPYFYEIDLVLDSDYTAPNFYEIDLVLGEITDTCTCPGLNQDWEIDLADACSITDDCDLGTGKLTFIGSGSLHINAIIDTTDMGVPPTEEIVHIDSNGIININ